MPCLLPAQYLSKFRTVFMVTEYEPILPADWPVAIDTMLNFDGHCAGDRVHCGQIDRQLKTSPRNICVSAVITFNVPEVQARLESSH